MYSGVHWLYLNLADANVFSFVPAWAAYRGILATPNALLSAEHRKTHLGLTPHLIRLFRNQNAYALEKELALEEVRRLKYPTMVSRLNCIYCWPDEDTARLAPKFWKNQGQHFDDRYLTGIGISSIKPPTVADTRWIDRYLINSTEPLSLTGTEWIDQYWSGSIYPWNGESDLPEAPLLECLVDGTALVYGTTLRMEAYALIEKLAPDTTGILEKGRLGVDICTRFDGRDEWRLGQIVPVLMTNEKRTSLVVNHLIFLDEQLAKSVNEKVTSLNIPPSEINQQALKVFERDELRLPDLRPLNIEVAWLNQPTNVNARINNLLNQLFLENGGDFAAAKEFQDRARAEKVHSKGNDLPAR